ncbi:MAG TPA: DUF481 domain-containing protein [Gammaproteobacteria bacterium]|nr:DUF481 domain-containing protein [Gammaproteobacteria bacterium]
MQLQNGDRLTGDIKSLDRGKIRVETDATDTIEIKWEYVSGLESRQYFEVVLGDGRVLYGSLAGDAKPNEVRVRSADALMSVPMPQIVRITPIESRLIDRIDMRVDIGYSLAKADAVTQGSVGYDFRYRATDSLVTFDLDASSALSEGEPRSDRVNAGFLYRRFFVNRRWDPVGIAQFERNDELDLGRRLAIGGGMSRWLADTSRNRISLTAGVVYSGEDSAETDDQLGTVEGMLGIALDWFRHDYPKLDVTTRLSLFERLQDSGRSRGNLDSTVSWALGEDFGLGFSLYYTFDSDPQGVGAKTDYGLSTAFGWKF